MWGGVLLPPGGPGGEPGLCGERPLNNTGDWADMEPGGGEGRLL